MARYNPGFVEDAIVNQEFQKVAEALDTPDKFLMLVMQYEAPSKPREGMIALSDGTSWATGSAGFYGYYGGSWVKLG